MDELRVGGDLSDEVRGAVVSLCGEGIAWDEEAVLPMIDQLGERAYRARDDQASGGHRFHHHDAEGLGAILQLHEERTALVFGGEATLIHQAVIGDRWLGGRDFFGDAIAPEFSAAEVVQDEARIVFMQAACDFACRIETLGGVARINQAMRIA